MKNIIFLTGVILLATIETSRANPSRSNLALKVESQTDTSRLTELDQYWEELSRTVREGDFEGYAATYHDDAVVIFAGGNNKMSLPISKALAGWKQGFNDTKSGKVKSNVAFRFSQRIGDETTAHETGIFYYTSVDSAGKYLAKHLSHFEMLMVKQNNTWYALMEYQKSNATLEEWEALK